MVSVVILYKQIILFINMIKQSYLQYIPEDKRQQCYNSMVQDVYYFYYGYRPNNNQRIKCINGNTHDLDKNNLILTDI